MRVAFLSELFHPHIGGCERRFLEIGKRLSKRGHDIHVFTVGYKKDLPEEEDVYGVHVHRVAYSQNYITSDNSRSLSGVLKYSTSVARLIASNNHDVCYSSEYPMLHSVLARPFASPFIQEWCEVWDRGWTILALQSILKRLKCHHVAVSDFTRRRLVKIGIPEEKISTIPNGIDYDNLSHFHEKKHGRIIYVGRLAPHKHVDMLINAFSKVQAKNCETELHIVGSGPLLPQIKRQASNVEHCYVHGFLPENEMIHLLRTSSLYVLPSEREGSGIAALESMATGTPVITVSFPDNATTELVNETNGLVVSPNADAMAQGMLTLLGDENRLSKMNENARLFAKEFDWENIVTRLEEVLKSVAEQS